MSDYNNFSARYFSRAQNQSADGEIIFGEKRLYERGRQKSDAQKHFEENKN